MKDGVFEAMFPLHEVRGRPAQNGLEGGNLRQEAKFSLSISWDTGGNGPEEKMGPMEKHIPETAD